MKISDKILLITFIAIVALTVILITGIGIYYSSNPGLMEILKGSYGKMISRDFTMAPFDSAMVDGNWEVEITRADEWRITITVPEALVENVKPEIDSKGVLRLNRWSADSAVLKLKAVVHTPAIAALEATGSAQVKFSGFVCKQLILRVLDAGRLSGSGSTVEDLIITTGGTAELNLSACSAVNVMLELKSTGKTALSLNGGQLQGK